MRERTFLSLLFFMSAFPEDMFALLLFKVGPVQVYPIDILYCMTALSFVVAVRSGALKALPLDGRLVCIFCAWVLVELVVGYARYGFRAIGESRLYLPFFAFFAPFGVLRKGEASDVEKVSALVVRTIYVAAFAGLMMFFFEIWYGGRFLLSPDLSGSLDRFEDFRGLRLLGSAQTYSIMLLGGLIILRQFSIKNVRKRQWLFAAFCIAAALITQNRTGFLSVVAAFALIFLFAGKLKVIVKLATLGMVIIALAGFLVPEVITPALSSLQGAFEPSEDDTGSWRILQLASAIDQALETPVFGQSLGSYFFFEVPGSGLRPIEVVPHNQYVLVFLKCGGIGMLLMFAFVVAFLLSHRGETLRMWQPTNASLALSVCLLVIVSQLVYGMAYPFILHFGVFFGFSVILRSAGKSSTATASTETVVAA